MGQVRCLAEKVTAGSDEIPRANISGAFIAEEIRKEEERPDLRRCARVCALCMRIGLRKPGINLRRKIRVNRGSAARKGVKGSRVP